MTSQKYTDDMMVRDCDPAPDLYCGNCGADYSDMTVGGLRVMAARWECPACQQYAREYDDEVVGPSACQHDWHYNGEINGRPYYGCQTCGAERTE